MINTIPEFITLLRTNKLNNTSQWIGNRNFLEFSDKEANIELWFSCREDEVVITAYVRDHNIINKQIMVDSPDGQCVMEFLVDVEEKVQIYNETLKEEFDLWLTSQ